MKRKTLITITAAAAVLTLAGCGGGGGGGNPSAHYKPYPYAPIISEELKAEYLDAVNEARSEGRYCGDKWWPAVPPLKWDDRLYRAAYEHANDMATTNYYEHDGSGTESDWTANVLGLGRGSHFGERIDNNRIDTKEPGSWRGENASWGRPSLEIAIQKWLDSPHHCENIMEKHYKTLGMAGVYREDSEYGYYWDQEFGSSTPK
jgi:uncharacterized protein YkwD